MDFKPVCDSTLSITQRLFTDRITRAVSENTAISVTPTHGTQEDVKKPQPPAHTAFHFWGNEREFSDCERIPTSTQQCFGIARPHRTAHLVIGVFQKLNRALSKRNGMSKERDARRDVRRVVLQRKEKQMRIFLQSNTAPRPATQEPRARFAQDLRWKKRLRMTADALHEAQATLQTSSVRSRCRPPAPRATPDTERRSPRPSAALSGAEAAPGRATRSPRPPRLPSGRPRRGGGSPAGRGSRGWARRRRRPAAGTAGCRRRPAPAGCRPPPASSASPRAQPAPIANREPLPRAARACPAAGRPSPGAGLISAHVTTAGGPANGRRRATGWRHRPGCDGRHWAGGGAGRARGRYRRGRGRAVPGAAGCEAAAAVRLCGPRRRGCGACFVRWVLKDCLNVVTLLRSPGGTVLALPAATLAWLLGTKGQCLLSSQGQWERTAIKE